MDCIRTMRAHRGLLKVRDAIEICDGRQALRDMPADKPLCAGHPVHGQLYFHAARLRSKTKLNPSECFNQHKLLMHLQKMPGLEYLASTQAYFDDKVHFIEIR